MVVGPGVTARTVVDTAADGCENPREHAQQRGLARSVGADDGSHLPDRDLRVDLVQHGVRTIAGRQGLDPQRRGLLFLHAATITCNDNRFHLRYGVMDVVFAPFDVSFVQRALWGGLLVSGICALAGTWIVVRGMAFLGDAMAHGMLPGVATASLLGGNPLIGAACSAAAMALGITALQRNSRVTTDTGIGLVFVGMLATGVIIVSRSQSFAADVTGFLFGDVLAIRDRDLGYLTAALALALALTTLGHRAFVALTFDPRKAHTLGLRPRLAHLALLALVTLAIVASFHVAGTLLVFGLLIAPPAAALHWADRIPSVMLLAAIFGGFATVTGLLVSWHAGTAAGATIVAVAVATFCASAAAAWLRDRVRTTGPGRRPRTLLAALAVILPIAGCGANTHDSAPGTESAATTAHGYVPGAEETDAPRTRLVVADTGGTVRIIDTLDSTVTPSRSVPAPTAARGDDRHAYLSAGNDTHIVDGGTWTVDHGDHQHYYRTDPREPDTLHHGHVRAAHSDPARTALITDSDTVLLDRPALDDGHTLQRHVLTDTVAVPYAQHLATVDRTTGHADIRDRDGVLHGYDITTGTPTAETPLLAEPVRDGTPPPVIEIDTERAYVNDPAGHTVHEIDYRDTLRPARRFGLDITPTHMVETGR